MANADTPRGFWPVGTLDGGPWNGATTRCVIRSANETATFIGDLVKLEGTGVTDSAGFSYPAVVQGAASDTAFFGVVTSFDPDRTDLTKQYREADTERYCQVVPATGGQLFAVQCSGAFALTDIGESADVTVGTGDTTTGLSAMELNSADIGTGANLHIVGVVNRPDNEIGTNADIIVRINEHTFGGDGTTV